MNVLTIGHKLEALKAEVGAENPKIVAFEQEAEAALKPIYAAILAELTLKGTVTPDMIAKAEALGPKLHALIDDFAKIAKDAEKALS